MKQMPLNVMTMEEAQKRIFSYLMEDYREYKRPSGIS